MTICLPYRLRDLDRSNRENEVTVVSPWRNPVPVKEYTMNPVIVYYYSDRWIPISGFSLEEAILLYRKALSLGKELLVYPPDLDPSTQIGDGRP